METPVKVQAMADMLSASPEKVYRMAQRGEIPAFKVGREWRFFPSKVVEHLEQRPDPWAQSPRSVRRRRVA